MKYFIFILFFIISLACYAKPVIHWYKHDLPPYYIASGKFKETGSSDKAQQFLEKLLPEFDHSTTFVSIKRLNSLAVSDKNFATLSLFKTKEREKFLIFSEPYSVRFLPHLVILKQNRDKFKKYIESSGKIDFEKVAADSNIKIGIIPKRVYSKTVNEILEKHKNKNNIDEVFSENATSMNINKLILKRSDCIIEYPEAVKYELDITNQVNSCLFIPIKNVPEFDYMYIAVPKTAEGKKLISIINNRIAKTVMNEEYINAVSSWNINPDSYKASYKTIMNNYLKIKEGKK